MGNFFVVVQGGVLPNRRSLAAKNILINIVRSGTSSLSLKNGFVRSLQTFSFLKVFFSCWVYVDWCVLAGPFQIWRTRPWYGWRVGNNIQIHLFGDNSKCLQNCARVLCAEYIWLSVEAFFFWWFSFPLCLRLEVVWWYGGLTWHVVGRCVWWEEASTAKRWLIDKEHRYKMREWMRICAVCVFKLLEIHEMDLRGYWMGINDYLFTFWVNKCVEYV